MEGAPAGVVSATALPYLILRLLRGRRQKKFGAQFPDALDTIVRSLRAGHPVPTAIAMVGREMPDPIGSEFGVVTDEITYGADLETAMRNLHGRVGSEDLPLFVTAVGTAAFGRQRANLAAHARDDGSPFAAGIPDETDGRSDTRDCPHDRLTIASTCCSD